MERVQIHTGEQVCVRARVSMHGAHKYLNRETMDFFNEYIITVLQYIQEHVSVRAWVCVHMRCILY